MAKKDKKKQSQGKDAGTSEVSKKFRQNPGLYIGSVIILVLVVVTFLGGDLLSGCGPGRGGDLTFGYYDNTPISWMPGNLLVQYYERVLRYYQSFGIPVENFHTQTEIMRQTFEAVVEQTAILQLMNRSNFSVSERLINQRVLQLPQFQHNGRFSPALYDRMSVQSQNNISRQVRDDIFMETFYSEFSTLLIPDSEVAFIASMATPMRTLDMVSFRIDDYPASEYLGFAQENPELFESIHLSRITADTEREARRILDSIHSGTLFEEAAISQSTDFYSDRGGDMGSRFFFELDWDIPNLTDRQNIFKLGNGEFSDIVNVGDGWAFFRVEEEVIKADFDDEVVMDRVRSYVRGFRRGIMEDWAILAAEEFIAEVNEAGFETAIRWRFLEKQTIGPFPMNYGNLDLFTSLDTFAGSINLPGFGSHDLSNLIQNENFWRIAFSTELFTPSEPLVQGNNVLVFYPTEHIEAEEFVKENVALMYESFWLENLMRRTVPFYFMNHQRMTNNFDEIFPVWYRIFFGDDFF
ncbi:MAG: SurA N-terminal domain-containing protein [Treponema sp.]|jgi:parvulin-like peptidyl-prolyl isomerase|nr:SurA N-terminal domain-containing protein [Treponema sp.]